MKNTLVTLCNKWKRNFAFAFALLFMSIVGAQAQGEVNAIQEAATDAIADAKEVSEIVLVAAFTLLVGFVIFKVSRRAVNKA